MPDFTDDQHAFDLWYGPCEQCGTSHRGFPRTHLVGGARCAEAQSRRIAIHSERLAALALEVGIPVDACHGANRRPGDGPQR